MSLYFVRIGGSDGPVKVGISIDVQRRLKQIALDYRSNVTLLAIMADGDWDEEQAIHARLEPTRAPAAKYRGFEVFDQSPELNEIMRPFLLSEPQEHKYGNGRHWKKN